MRRFGHGCYTLMNDDDPTSNKESLDVYFTFIGYFFFFSCFF